MLTDNNQAINEIYNVACGDRTSLNQLWDSINFIAGKDLKPIYGSDRSGDIRDSLANVEKAANAFDYHPLIKLELGLERTFASF